MAELMLDEKRNKALMEYVAAMKGLYGDELVSLCLFGEGAGEPVGRGVSHLKLLMVLRQVGVSQLSRYASAHAKWHRIGLAAPLTLTEDMLHTSTDVFPIEFLEMKEAYVLLHGRDVLGGLSVGLDNLRLQCEEQVKGKLIHLRQSYMEAGGDPHALRGLVASSIAPFTEAMRNVLRLMGKGAPVDKETAIRQFAAESGLEATPFLDALHVRRAGYFPDKDDLTGLFGRYLAEVEKMAEFIDKFKI